MCKLPVSVGLALRPDGYDQTVTFLSPMFLSCDRRSERRLLDATIAEKRRGDMYSAPISEMNGARIQTDIRSLLAVQVLSCLPPLMFLAESVHRFGCYVRVYTTVVLLTSDTEQL